MTTILQRGELTVTCSCELSEVFASRWILAGFANVDELLRERIMQLSPSRLKRFFEQLQKRFHGSVEVFVAPKN
jgi:hypothetical protein